MIVLPLTEVLLHRKVTCPSTTFTDSQEPQLSNGTCIWRVYLAVNQVLPHSHPTLCIRFGPAFPYTIAMLNSRSAVVPFTVVILHRKGDLPKYHLH